MSIPARFYDADGSLVESEAFHEWAFSEACAKAGGRPATPTEIEALRLRRAACSCPMSPNPPVLSWRPDCPYHGEGTPFARRVAKRAAESVGVSVPDPATPEGTT